MLADGFHPIGECADPVSCPRHKGNIIAETEDRLKFAVEYAKRNDVPGMIPRGATVEKCTWEKGDLHAIGARAKIIGCFGAVEGTRGYFIEWEDLPGEVGFVIEPKIRPIFPTEQAGDGGGHHVT